MTTRGIGKFFEDLGFPLRNSRWSWGSNNGNAVLLTVWDDQRDVMGRYARVLGPRRAGSRKFSPGLSERIDHIRTLWAGGLPAYLVMAKAKDESAKQRVIESYDASKVWAVDSLHAMEDGSVWAELGDAVPVAKLSRHSLRHRVRPTPAEFPIAGSTAGGASSRAGRAPAYLAALPAMRAQLIYVARRRATITYAEARAPFNVWSLVHRHAMSRLGHECLNAGEPILTSLIVDPITKRCSAGFESEFHRDDQRERESCYQFWAAGGTLSGKAPALRTRSRRVDELNDFQNRALKFANVAVRPDQAAFRREVFIAFNGACIVTGCSVAAALDAAHRRGRDWKLGHNRAEDGLLLRKDIHALYDAGLVKITDDGKLIFSREVPTHYRQYV